MVKRSIYPPGAAWIIFSFGLSAFLCCSGYSLTRATNYQLQLAEYRLQVGTALSQVKKVSDTLEKSAKTSALAPNKKQEIQQLTEKSDRIIDRVEQDIEAETSKLTNPITE